MSEIEKESAQNSQISSENEEDEQQKEEENQGECEICKKKSEFGFLTTCKGECG